ncbi:MAG: 5-formyltetrahydrofolate cyclo-ligase [Deltaproteobacteria bacterium HGW-Deltaproteobacteria-14]|jgi:5-formyltetrahydrofolate cyclo-ligase|nr:MAG: 5-formyltetrahydrofolate cyclo-ligase [Deltaproteobacteria bacterium HGW-Deltaproteobacteria-14]
MTSKGAWRARLRRARRELDGAARAAAEAQLNARLLDLADAVGARIVAIYSAAGSEADPGPFAAAWRARGGVTAYPRVASAEAMTLARVDAASDLTPGFRGVLEPAAACVEVPVGDVDLVVVPGLGFAADGRRLGQGGGFYDRLLAAPERRALAVGFAFGLQVVDGIPTEGHDVVLDAIVTERGVARGGVWTL